MSWREGCLWRISQASRSSADIVRELADISRELGFEYCSYVLRLPPISVADPAVVWASTYPTKWLDHYFSHHYLDIDPLLKRVARDPTPVAWTHKTFKTQPEFWEEARAHGIRYGWASSTHGSCTTGMLSLARSENTLNAEELDESEAKLMWLAHAAHGAISNLEMQKYRPAPGHELSPREREVLRWTAAGKTAGEIAAILGISARTVTFHITSALQKLDSVNKTQAVMKAMMLDMLFS